VQLIKQTWATIRYLLTVPTVIVLTAESWLAVTDRGIYGGGGNCYT
jgi:hypothetical protein